MSSVTFIPLGFLRQQPNLPATVASSGPSGLSGRPKLALGSLLRRTHSDPMRSLPPLNTEWADAASARPSLTAQPPAPHAPTSAPVDQDVMLVSTLLLDHKITNLEERLKTSMGPWALYGLRYSTLVGLATAATTKVALVVLAGVLVMSPLVSLGIFLGVLVGSIAVGVLAQTIARRKFVRSGESAIFSQEIMALQQELLQQDRLSGTQIKSLRRLQIMSNQIRGGFKQSIWNVFYGITGFDPELARMMRRANDAPVAREPAGSQGQERPKSIFRGVFASKTYNRSACSERVSGSGAAEK